MSRTFERATTLLEVLIAILILCMVMFGMYNIQLFSDNQVVSATRKSSLQRDGSFLIEHMSKNMLGAVSNSRTYPVSLEGTNKLRVWVDDNADGLLQDHLDATHDRLIYYERQANGSVVYCNNASITSYPSSTSCSAPETLTTHLLSAIDTGTITIDSTTNYVGVNLTTCWNVANSSTCGSLKNPSTTFRNRIIMPGVSTM